MFDELRRVGKKAFMPFITAGDPDAATTPRLLEAVAGAGADIVELGIPYSDPLADGPTIQNSYTRALDKGLKLSDIFNAVRQARKSVDIPIVSMVSYSIVFRVGPVDYVEAAEEAGLDGAIIPDLPLEEADELRRQAAERDFKLILLAAPTTPFARQKKIALASTGFLYYISVAGVTGARDRLPDDLIQNVRRLKEVA